MNSGTDAETRLIAETFETVERACIPPLAMAGPPARPPKMWYDVVDVWNLDEVSGEKRSVERAEGGFVALEDYDLVVEALREALEEIAELKEKEKA
ncbi:MAG TPA: hypothetical protein VMW24_09520 [Sedimentisphaerales bacterium]|nr:hypothetical protein [Sedimentisphaerales bacterium]